jgi:hypothetical protein
MTRKDFVTIANALWEAQRMQALTRPFGGWKGYHDEIVMQLCEALKETNPNFKPERFIEAAGGNS